MMVSETSFRHSFQNVVGESPTTARESRALPKTFRAFKTMAVSGKCGVMDVIKIKRLGILYFACAIISFAIFGIESYTVISTHHWDFSFIEIICSLLISIFFAKCFWSFKKDDYKIKKPPLLKVVLSLFFLGDMFVLVFVNFDTLHFRIPESQQAIEFVEIVLLVLAWLLDC